VRHHVFKLSSYRAAFVAVSTIVVVSFVVSAAVVAVARAP
jgi:hypothetical protein